jgi:hypothetical protein
MVLKAAFYETLSPTGTAVGISAGNLIIPGAQYDRQLAQAARVTVEIAAIYYLLTGESPASGSPGTGHLLSVGDIMTIEGVSDVKNFRCVDKTGSGGAKVKVTTFFTP